METGGRRMLSLTLPRLIENEAVSVGGMSYERVQFVSSGRHKSLRRIRTELTCRLLCQIWLLTTGSDAGNHILHIPLGQQAPVRR